MIRAGSSSQNPGEMAASRVPAENSPMASMNTVRVEIRCSRKPVVGMTTAMVNMNAVVSHCTVRALMPRSTIRWGSATLMIVSFKIITKVAISKVMMMLRSRTDSLPVCGPAAVVVMEKSSRNLIGGWPSSTSALT